MDSFTEFDDDLLFLHLERQILLLMADEDGEDDEFPPKSSAAAAAASVPDEDDESISWDCFNHSRERSLPVTGEEPNLLHLRKTPPLSFVSSKSTSPCTDFSGPGMRKLQVCSQRESLGTGVFIPQLRQTKGKSKRGPNNRGSSRQAKNRRSTHE
ncbi:hypothetical protein H6P81_002884 [Aristolochia fimbriata]|uniref:Uncharacterized protein n=1 Tax=Aristolochia fimbriata TaxID=158543 RepID=A0AAV7FC51_ARIFI|nr:hypothetical protein H6P81_002884 [Aristolochia fimbriata]